LIKHLTPRQFHFLLLGVILLQISDLYLFITQFLFVYTDSDQTILWHAAKDMSEGKFYEPAFYGQAYNSMLEALIAVPFIRIGVYIPYALGISTLLLSYSVIWLWAWYFYKKKAGLLSLICLALPLFMPSEFQIMIGISRGFVTGISVTLWGIYFLLTNQGKLKLMLAGFCIALGLILNPNTSIILSAFVIYYLLKPNAQKIFELTYLSLGFIPALLYKVFCIWFYTSHPNYNLHIFPNTFQYTLQNWLYIASEVFFVFKGLMPWVNNLGCLSLILLMVLVVLIFKKSNKSYEKLAALSGFLFIIFTFGINKVSDGTGSPFFAYARMYLGIPVLYVFYLSILIHNYKFRFPVYFIGIIILLSFILKTLPLNHHITNIVKHNTGVVKVVKIKDLCLTCDSIATYLTKTKSDIIVLKTKRDEINYGCPVLSHIKTIHPSYERRTWIYEQEMTSPRSSLLVYSETPLKEQNTDILTKHLYLVNFDTRVSIKQWFEINRIKLRKYKNKVE
jgi:hypothetical protein